MKPIFLKILIAFFALGLRISTSYAQNTGNLKGRVLTSDGTPAEFVNVSIKGTSKGTSTDGNGNFSIRNISPGSRTIVASFIGLEKQEQAVEIKAKETATVRLLQLNSP
jgi:iron complex outermembrane recepter protein